MRENGGKLKFCGTFSVNSITLVLPNIVQRLFILHLHLQVELHKRDIGSTCMAHNWGVIQFQCRATVRALSHKCISLKSTRVSRGSVLDKVVPRVCFHFHLLLSSIASRIISLACSFLCISTGKDSACNVCRMFLILCSFIPV